MDNQLEGRIKVIMDTITFESGFSKREFVITTNEQYPQPIKFELLKDKTTVLDSYAVGDQVSVNYNCRGNEFNGKFYVNLQAWKLAKSEVTVDEVAPAVAATPKPITDGQDDDLPF